MAQSVGPLKDAVLMRGRGQPVVFKIMQPDCPSALRYYVCVDNLGVFFTMPAIVWTALDALKVAFDAAGYELHSDGVFEQESEALGCMAQGSEHDVACLACGRFGKASLVFCVEGVAAGKFWKSLLIIALFVDW
jgi:hypothetical protein